MKFASYAAAMVTLAVAVGSIIVHGVWAQSLEPTTNPQSRLEPNSSLAPPPVIEQRRIRYQSSIDANGQPHTRAVWETVPVSVSQPADSETAELAAAEVQAAKEAQELVQELQAVDSEGTKTELKAKLRAALAKQFDAQQKQRTREIASIEERLNKLKETLQKRDAAKEKIVDRRLDQLTGVRDELAWEETQGVQPPGNNRFPNSFAYPPGLSSPQPMGVPSFGGPRAPNTVPPPPNFSTGPSTLQFPVRPTAPATAPAPATPLLPSATPGTLAPPAPPAPAVVPALPAAAAPVAPTVPGVPSPRGS